MKRFDPSRDPVHLQQPLIPELVSPLPEVGASRNPNATTPDSPPIIPPARGASGRGASGFGASGSPGYGEPEAESVNGQVVAQVWAELSPHKRECGLAGKRFRELVDRIGKDPLLLLHAISEHAVEQHHAAAITEEKMRNRIARINEREREEEKRREREDLPRTGTLRSIADILRRVRSEEG